MLTEGIQNNQGRSDYGSSIGSLETRKVLGDFLTQIRKTPYHFDQEYSQIALTRGVTAGIQHYLTGLKIRHAGKPDLRVLVPTPAYAWYKAAIEKVPGAVLDKIDTSGTGWKLDAKMLKQALAAHPDTDAIILNYPCNPTGKTLSKPEWQALADVLEKHAGEHPDFRVILDHGYYDLQFNEPVGLLSVASEKLKPHIIEFNSVAKFHAFAGIGGLGFAASENTGDIAMLRGQLNTGLGFNDFEPFLRKAFSPGYFSDERVEQARSFYRRRCKFVANYINEKLGAVGQNHDVALMPDGGIFVFADFSRWIGKSVPKADELRTKLSKAAPKEYKAYLEQELFKEGRINDDKDLSFYLLSAAHIVTIPGKDFGTGPEQGMLRLALGDIGDLTSYKSRRAEDVDFNHYLPSEKRGKPLDDLRKLQSAIDRAIRALGALKEHNANRTRH
jgi:aspartate/methionine/tyrosine aminotransferase